MAASGTMRNSLECSSSGRGASSIHASLGLQRSRGAAFSRFLPPVTQSVPAPQRSSLDRLPQPPLGHPAARRQHEPLRVAQEVRESTPKKMTLARRLRLLNKNWGVNQAIEFGTGQGNLPTVLLTHPQTGMQLVVYLYGATIAQWMKNDGTATFYDGPDDIYKAGKPLRTGVSVHFPQHREGLLPYHGFADSMMWDVVEAGFDTPEIGERLDQYFEDLQARGLVTRELMDGAAEDEEKADQLAAVVSAHPPDLTVQSDLSPYVTLRLRDTEETRAMWPHRFELLYKITLETLDCITEEEAQELKAVYGITPLGEDEETEEGGIDQPGSSFVASGRQEAGEQAAAAEEAEGRKRVAEGAAAPKRRGRPRKTPAAGADGDAEEGEAGGGDDGDEEEEEDGAYEGPSSSRSGAGPDGEADADLLSPQAFVPPVQIRQEFWVRNLDKRGSPPMQFHLGSLARFVTLQQPQFGEWVKVLGLGGSQTFDYTSDPRYPEMDLCMEDYLHYQGQRVDATYIGAADATVYLCPGNRTHFEFIQRAGFRDMFVEQPGQLEVHPEWGRVATMGTGYVASTKKLEAGGEWHAESVIRFHNRYWRAPLFGDDSMIPLPGLTPEDIDAGDDGGDDEGEDGDVFHGLPSDTTGLMAA